MKARTNTVISISSLMFGLGLTARGDAAKPARIPPIEVHCSGHLDKDPSRKISLKTDPKSADFTLVRTLRQEGAPSDKFPTVKFTVVQATKEDFWKLTAYSYTDHPVSKYPMSGSLFISDGHQSWNELISIYHAPTGTTLKGISSYKINCVLGR